MSRPPRRPHEPIDDDLREEALSRRAARRLLPFLMACYLVAYLDRVNVGFAALTMNRDLGLSASAYGLGAGMFFLGYFLFEVPSNLILERVGARVWIARIMITWSIVSGATAFVSGTWSFYALRFLLGLAEAGFFPGIILYLTYWFPARERAAMVGTFMAAVPVSLVVGAPLSTWIMQTADGAHGLAGWQWLFLIEAAPSLVLGCLVLRLLPDGPEQARWLSAEQGRRLAARVARDRQEAALPRLSLGQALSHPRVLGLGLVYFGLSAGLYGVGLWLPQIVAGFGLGLVETGLVAALPYLAAAIGMVAWTRHSDRTGERVWHVALPAMAGGLAIALAGAPSPALAMIGLGLAALGVFCALATFWTLPTALLTGSAAAGGIALINAIGGLGGFAGPYLVGWIRDATGRFDLALAAIALIMAAAGPLTLVVARPDASRQPSPPASRTNRATASAPLPSRSDEKT